jgi:undecaprenyl diphosphate synthase
MIDPKKIPHHVAIIMDGNGRWAARRGLPRIAGHRAGAKSVEESLKAAEELGIRVLTLYAFSTENWKRPKAEVSALFDLLVEYLEREAPKLNEKKIRFTAIGRIGELPDKVREKIEEVARLTRNNRAFRLNLALNYGGRAEIADAARAIANDVSSGRIGAKDIDDQLFARYLYDAELPDPDLMIRTSGEMRISNFLLWQLAYSEIYVTRKLWPDFRKDDLKKAVLEYQNRERRFGG